MYILVFFYFLHSSQSATLPSRLFAPASILHFVEAEFSHHLPRYQAACFEVLGSHPFHRQDVLVLPKCFASLGLARFVLSLCLKISRNVILSAYMLGKTPEDHSKFTPSDMAGLSRLEKHPYLFGTEY